MISPARDLRQYLTQVPDPRGCKGRRHPLSAILTAVICAVLSGANGYKPIVALSSFLGGCTSNQLTFGISSGSNDGPFNMGRYATC